MWRIIFLLWLDFLYFYRFNLFLFYYLIFLLLWLFVFVFVFAFILFFKRFIRFLDLSNLLLDQYLRPWLTVLAFILFIMRKFWFRRLVISLLSFRCLWLKKFLGAALIFLNFLSLWGQNDRILTWVETHWLIHGSFFVCQIIFLIRIQWFFIS